MVAVLRSTISTYQPNAENYSDRSSDIRTEQIEVCGKSSGTNISQH